MPPQRDEGRGRDTGRLAWKKYSQFSDASTAAFDLCQEQPGRSGVARMSWRGVV